MVHRSKWFLIVLLLVSAFGAAADRTAVLELFGRPGCGICTEARQALATLREEMGDRAVLLEYDYDVFLIGRQERFWAGGTTATYLPLVMVGSGFRTTSGPVDHEPVFRTMLNDDLARPAEAEVTAYYRRASDSVRAYIDISNISNTYWYVEEDAAVWLVAYESTTATTTTATVRTTEIQSLPFDLAPGQSTSLTVDTPPISAAYWPWMKAVVLAEYRPGGFGSYDMMQAADALPADLYASPEHLSVAPDGQSTELELTGPHVLTWSATSDVPWIEITPASGALPATPTIHVDHQLRPKSQTSGTITFSASGDEMAFSTTVGLEVDAGFRRSGRRVRPAG